MHVYELAAGVEGAVTVGDDTTAVAGDILRRFGVPVIGIVDGDGDGLHKGKLAAGSLVLTVGADDKAGLKVKKEIFGGKDRSAADFAELRRAVAAFLAGEATGRRKY